MSNFLEDLKKYFEINSREQILEDWAKTEEYDQTEILVSTFLNHCVVQPTKNIISNFILNGSQKYSSNFNSGFLF